MIEFTALEEKIYADYRQRGIRDHKRGCDVNACPVISPGSPQYEGWVDGWNEREADKYDIGG